MWPTGVLGRRPISCNAASLAGSNCPQCWNCGAPRGPIRGDGFFCPQCRALQPPDSTRDHFSLMDWYGNGFGKRPGAREKSGIDVREGRADQVWEGEGGAS